MKIIIVTGATSFLGRNVTRGLLDEGHKVYVFVRKNSRSLKQLPRTDSIIYIYGDLEKLEIIKSYVKKADTFIHFAWDGSGYKGRTDNIVQQKNIEYSIRALRIAMELECNQFVFSGSQAEYGNLSQKITENTRCCPVSAYGTAKYKFGQKASELCVGQSISFIHLRIFSIYGVDDREGTLVRECIKRFNNGETMELGPCSQYWNYLYISDFVRAILCIVDSDLSTGIYNIAGLETKVLREFVLDIFELSSKKGTYHFGVISNNPEGSPSLCPDINKISRLLGWKPVISFREGIKRIMEENQR